jgi:hypothetical protein
MMKMILSILLFIIPLVFAQEKIIYQLNRGESLSLVAYKYCRKVYGSSGFVKKIKNLNPQLVSNENFVLSGTKIFIPDQDQCPPKWRHPSEDLRPMEVLDKTLVKNSDKTSDENSTELRPSSFFITPMAMLKVIGFTQNSNGQSSSLAAKPIYGLRAGYLMPWSEQLTSSLSIGIHQEDYHGSKAKSIDQESYNRMQLDFSLEWKKRLIGSFGAMERTAIADNTATYVRIQKALVPYLGLEWILPLVEYGKRSTAASIEGKILNSAKATELKMKSGESHGFSLILNDHSFKNRFQFKFSYLFFNQDTTFSSQEEEMVGVWGSYFF